MGVVTENLQFEAGEKKRQTGVIVSKIGFS